MPQEKVTILWGKLKATHPYCAFSLADISTVTFPGKNKFRLVLKLLLMTNYKKMTSGCKLPPVSFLTVCKIVHRQISDTKQSYCWAFFPRQSLMYAMRRKKQKQLHQNHLMKQKREFSRTCGENKPNRIKQPTTKYPSLNKRYIRIID